MNKRFLRPALTFILICAVSFSCAHKEKAAVNIPGEVTGFSGIHESVTIQNNENLKLFNQYWAPADNVKAVILVLHGTTFHSGVYVDTGKYLAANGYVVYATDYQGWGRSEGKGKRGYIDTVEALFRAAGYVDREIEQFNSPVLLLHGTEDVIMPVSSSESFIKNISSTDKDLKIYETGHATLVEPSRFEVLLDVKAWLDCRI